MKRHRYRYVKWALFQDWSTYYYFRILLPIMPTVKQLQHSSKFLSIYKCLNDAEIDLAVLYIFSRLCTSSSSTLCGESSRNSKNTPAKSTVSKLFRTENPYFFKSINRWTGHLFLLICSQQKAVSKAKIYTGLGELNKFKWPPTFGELGYILFTLTNSCNACFWY